MVRARANLVVRGGGEFFVSSPPMRYRAVLFDIGGVVVGSPLAAIAAYERELGIDAGFINRVVITAGAAGGWSRLERGELTLEEFYPVFERDCETAGCRVSARALMVRVAESTVPRPAMLEAVRRIRANGLLAAAVTNNWKTEEDGGSSALRVHFDAFIESAVLGLRKPDPRIFEIACETLHITPPEAVLLDDIGVNLKSARALGMSTIKVVDPETALAELEAVLGFSLR
jgi:putative hydrolase of the HAD superfamily